MWNIFQDILEFQKSISKSYLDHSWPWPVPVEWFVLLPKGHFLTLHICAQWLEALRLRAKHTTHDTQSSSCASCNEPRETLIVAPPFPGHCRRSQPHWENWWRPQESLLLHCTNAISKKSVNVPFWGQFRCLLWTILCIIRCWSLNQRFMAFCSAFNLCCQGMSWNGLRRPFFFVTDTTAMRQQYATQPAGAREWSQWSPGPGAAKAWCGTGCTECTTEDQEHEQWTNVN